MKGKHILKLSVHNVQRMWLRLQDRHIYTEMEWLGGDGQGRGLLHSGRITNSRRLLLSLVPRHSACLISEMRSSIPRRIIKSSVNYSIKQLCCFSSHRLKLKVMHRQIHHLVVMYSRSNFLSPKLKTFGFTAAFRNDAPDLLTVT